MKQILIATHGKMASGIRYTAELIVGKMDEITTIDAYVTPEDNVEKKFEEYFAQHENDRIFVFTRSDGRKRKSEASGIQPERKCYADHRNQPSGPDAGHDGG